MRHRAPLTLLAFGLLFIFSLSTFVYAEEPKLFVPDKALCAKMLRLGKESYSRGKYLDAKEYFRKAVQADPGSEVAWRHYDQTVIFGLAEKVEKEAGFLAPDVSTRGELQAGGTQEAPATPAPSPKPEAKKKIEFKIVQDEGC